MIAKGLRPCPFCPTLIGPQFFCCEECVDKAHEIEMGGGQQLDHNCMDHRQRGLNEGDDVITERCSFCGRTRFETDGVRPMAWFIDPTNPTGNRYAYDVPHNDPTKSTVWKFGVGEGN